LYRITSPVVGVVACHVTTIVDMAWYVKRMCRGKSVFGLTSASRALIGDAKKEGLEIIVTSRRTSSSLFFLMVFTYHKPETVSGLQIRLQKTVMEV